MFYITQFSDLKIDREKIESLVEKKQDLGWNRENFETLASSNENELFNQIHSIICYNYNEQSNVL